MSMSPSRSPIATISEHRRSSSAGGLLRKRSSSDTAANGGADGGEGGGEGEEEDQGYNDVWGLGELPPKAQSAQKGVSLDQRRLSSSPAREDVLSSLAKPTIKRVKSLQFLGKLDVVTVVGHSWT